MRFVMYVGLLAVVGIVRFAQAPTYVAAKVRGRSFKWFTPNFE